MDNKRLSTVAITILVTGAALTGCLGGANDDSDDGNPLGDAGADGRNGQPALKGEMEITGSSTLHPVGAAWAEEFEAAHRDVHVTYNVVGTGGGFQKFCRDEAAMTGASRPIKDSENSECAANGIEPYEVQIGIDGLAVVVSTRNTFAQDLTVEELNRIWTADKSKQVNRWSELRPEWPNEEIELYGPGTNSGTFDYFVEAIIQEFDGKDTKGRSDYVPSEDDNLLVQGIASSPYALGYFGLAYVHENTDKVRAVKVDDGDGPVEPTPENVAAGTYAPLARPIFYYTDGEPTGIPQAFLEFGLSDEGQELVAEVGYIPLPADKLAAMRATVSG